MSSSSAGSPAVSLGPLCLGAGPFGTRIAGSALDELLQAFLAAGCGFVDTAHCYACWVPGGVGASERELGAALRRLGATHRVTVATKGGHSSFGDEYRRPERYLAPEQVEQDLAESLERLGLPAVQIYYLHRDDPRVPVGELIDVLNRAADAGKIGLLGASNWPTARIEAANAYAAARGLRGFTLSQCQWSLAVPKWTPGRDPTTRYVTPEDAAWYAAAGLAVVGYSATAGGYFSGAAAAEAAYGTPENAARRDRARSLAALLGCTPGQVALAWLRAQAPHTIPLFGTTNPVHLAEAVGSLDVRLTAAQAEWLRNGGEEPA